MDGLDPNEVNGLYLLDILSERGHGYPVASEKHRLEEAVRRFGIVAVREAVDEAQGKQRREGVMLRSWVGYVEAIAAQRWREKRVVKPPPQAPAPSEPAKPASCAKCEDSGWVAYLDTKAGRKRAARCACAAGAKLAHTGAPRIDEVGG